jgi:hypothetical protein
MKLLIDNSLIENNIFTDYRLLNEPISMYIPKNMLLIYLVIRKR